MRQPVLVVGRQRGDGAGRERQARNWRARERRAGRRRGALVPREGREQVRLRGGRLQRGGGGGGRLRLRGFGRLYQLLEGREVQVVEVEIHCDREGRRGAGAERSACQCGKPPLGSKHDDVSNLTRYVWPADGRCCRQRRYRATTRAP
eukprot:2775302-Prymnesium_polylepis.1